MRRSSIKTPCILKYAASHDVLFSYSMKAYCKLSPVFASRMTSQLKILPNRPKMSSRSSSPVTGFSLHTNKTFSGGFTSAKGRSPIISSVSACASASRSRRRFSKVSSSTPSFSCRAASSAMRTVFICASVGGGLELGSRRPAGSGYGSSRTTVCLMRISINGYPFSSTIDSLIFSSASNPSTTLPKIAALPSRKSVSSPSVTMNCDAASRTSGSFAAGAVAMLTVPRSRCFNLGWKKAGNVRLEESPDT